MMFRACRDSGQRGLVLPFLRRWSWMATVLALAGAAVPHPVLAQGECLHPYYWQALAGSSPKSNNCFGSTGFRCYKAVDGAPYFALGDGTCDPTAEECTVQLRVPLELPGVEDMVAEDGLFGSPTPWVFWFPQATAPSCPRGSAFVPDCGQDAVCGTSGFGGKLDTDFLETWVEKAGVSCANADEQTGEYSIRVRVCNTACSVEDLVVEGLTFATPQLAEDIGCPPPPPPEVCGGDAQCTTCPAPGVGVGGDGYGAGGPGDGQTGDGAYLRYAAGGAGHPGLPGSAAWNLSLGRYWSHDYAQRIVEDPDDTHVWLITEYGTFREFGGLAGGVYETLAPSDEYRTLHRTAGGWELHDLDGTVMAFDGAGLWLSTTDRHGNAKVATYSSGGVLESVSFPDGRREDFAYHPGGKLATITVVGVDNLTDRAWKYTWVGDDLALIERPDGTDLEYRYDDPAFPGYLTRITLVGTDDTSERVLQAYELDAEGRVAETWKGDVAKTGPHAVERWSLTYDSDSQTTVTDPLGQEIVYTFGRDDDSAKVKVTQISGDCPTCGLGPNSVMAYGDPANPLLPTEVTDGNGNLTLYQYDANGRMTRRTEAATTTDVRITEWAYDTTYPGLVTELRRPSVVAGAERVLLTPRDFDGTVPIREIRGFEAGQPFDCTVAGAPCYETLTTFNGGSGTGGGQPETVDPPGHGTADVTTYTYDPARGNGFLVMDSRVDPIVGATLYGHDAFNRRTSVTDPNGVTTETTYDELDRVESVIQKGAPQADDLLTDHQYNVFGDLERIVLPEGNVIEYGYDTAGRLTSIERKPDPATPGERTVYTLDAAGNRTSETLERWDMVTGVWITDSTTAYLYSTRCHLDQVLHPDGTVTEYAYDCNGNLERTWDANHPSNAQTEPPTATYAYDALDRLISVTRPWDGPDPGPSVTFYAYDVQDHLVSVTDAEGSETTYEYSDRDLLTEEVSLVSGTTTHRYDAHGELVETTDARGVVETRTLDALDRVTFVDYPGTDLDVAYTYDDPLVPFSLGRLTAIERDGHSVAYEYDRFGRLSRDGELTFTHDKNGNRTTIAYPGGVGAIYTHDFADREVTLSVLTPAGPASVVNGAGYLASGPLSSLAFATGATETRTFTPRYFPQSITLEAATDRAWTYLTDAVGNIERIEQTADCAGTLILDNHTVTGEEIEVSCAAIEVGPAYSVASGGDLTLTAATRVLLKSGFSVASGGQLVVGTDPSLNAPVVREYTYQDHDYFLESATGPWGSQSWTYDRIGNRLSETDNGLTDDYEYELNAAGGNTARLTNIGLAALGGTRSFQYSDAGHQTQVNSAGNIVDFQFDAAGRMSQATSANGTADFLYDGRSYLREAGNAATSGTTTPTYDSAGRLHSLLHQPPGGGNSTRYQIFYLAGRPVAQLALEAQQPERWWYLTTDHLGTPLVATDANQEDLWTNHFAPYGEDTRAGTSEGALQNEIFLRFPGQWEDSTWQGAMMGAEGYYNVHRWYQPSAGRYARPDPLRLGRTFVNSYVYVGSSPTTYLDPTGQLRCGCNDECPSGKWTYNGWGASLVAAGGLSISRGTFTCLDDPRVEQPVKALCGLLGPMVGGGIGLEGSTPFAPSACACNGEDLLGEGQTALIGSAGPLSVTVSGCDQPGPFSIGDRTANVGGFKSTGAGLGWVSCDVTPREGWWDWDYTVD